VLHQPFHDRTVVERLMEHAQDAEAEAADMILWQSQNPDLVKLPD